MAQGPSVTAQDASAQGRQRLDRWLWAARFFKTRSLARKAITTGRVRLNGDVAKPARAVAVGDRLDITTPAARFVVEVVALNEQRRPAREAQSLYQESAQSVAARHREVERKRQRRAGVVFDRARPDRRTRRVQRRLRRGEEDG